MPLHVSGFTDEVIDPIRDQLQVARTAGLKQLALRFFKDDDKGERRNVSSLKPAEAGVMARMIADYGLKVSSLGSPIGKKSKFISGPEVTVVPIEEVIEKEVKPITDILAVFSFPPVRIFAGNRVEATAFESIQSEVVDKVGQIAEAVRSAGGVVEVENEPFTAAATVEDLADLLTALNLPHVGGVFDEANAWATGYKGNPEKLISAFLRAAPYVNGLHIKCLNPDDPKLQSGHWTQESELTGFQVVGGPVFKEVFAFLKTLISESNDTPQRNGRPIVATLEPHMSLSERFSGRTEHRKFMQATEALDIFAKENGVVTDIVA